jgi:hypothetical protein
MTTLTVNIKDVSQISIIKKILKVFDVEVIDMMATPPPPPASAPQMPPMRR